jgi:hypothetical protein
VLVAATPIKQRSRLAARRALDHVTLRLYLPCKGIATNRVAGLVIRAAESGSAQTAGLPFSMLEILGPERGSAATSFP